MSARLSEQVVTTNVGAALENLGAALGATTARHQPGRVNHRQRLVYLVYPLGLPTRLMAGLSGLISHAPL